MPLQFFDIKDSQIKFVNESNNPEKRLENAEHDIANMIYDSMMDKLKIHQLEMELGNVLLEIMNLKLGGN